MLFFMKLSGTSAIITGSSGQLGSKIAICLGGMGMNCLCHYHSNKDQANETAAVIQSLGQKAVAVQANLTSVDAAAILMAEAQKLGAVRVIINSASIFARQPIGTLNQSEVSELMAVNLTTPIQICNEFAKYLKQEGIDPQQESEALAAIINMVDVAGVRQWGEYGPYCASRAGLIGLTKSLSKELAPAVTVNAIAPGIVTWPGKMDASEEQKQLQMIPAGRFGKTKDITRSIEFLLNNDYITGQVLCIDGGRSI